MVGKTSQRRPAGHLYRCLGYGTLLARWSLEHNIGVKMAGTLVL